MWSVHLMFSLVLSLLDFQGDHSIGIRFRVRITSEDKWLEVGGVSAGRSHPKRFVKRWRNGALVCYGLHSRSIGLLLYTFSVGFGGGR